jgi:hypothetical protein
MSEVFAYDGHCIGMYWEWEEEEVHIDANDFVGNYNTVNLGDTMSETKRSFRPHHEARRKTARLSLFYLRYLYFFAFTVVISIEGVQRWTSE